MTIRINEAEPNQPNSGGELIPAGQGQVGAWSPERAWNELAISHVARRYRCYPGETVTLYTRVEVIEPVAGFVVQISLPPHSALKSQWASPNQGEGLPDLVVTGDARYLAWRREAQVSAGEHYDYTTQVEIAQTHRDQLLESTAIVSWAEGEDARPASETAAIQVLAKGRYLKYLPGIYTERDELMGRFLMLFESFLAPIEMQIDTIYYYFDPKIMPADLLPWLASWLDLVLDERWSEEKRRILLSSIVELYRRRGTRRGLQEYLEIYTGQRPTIIEHRANNFRLGPATRLGPGIALGHRNAPHTFTVVMRLPPMLEAEGERAKEGRQKEKERRHKIEMIIEAEKPAHTTYTLEIEVANQQNEPASTQTGINIEMKG